MAALALLGAACAGTQKPAAGAVLPVAVTRMTPTFGDEGRGALGLDLAVDNRRGAAGTLSGMQCEVFLEGRWFAAAEGALRGPLAAGAEVPLRLRIPWTIRRHSGPPPAEEWVFVEVRGAVDVLRGPTGEKLAFRHGARLRVFGAPVRQAEEL